MKKLLIFICILTICSSCAKKEETAIEETINIHSISCAEAKDKILIENAFLIDVRSKEEYAKGSISGALNLPLTEFEENVSKIIKDKNAEVIVFCQSGNRSSSAAAILKKLGYKNIFDLGSINNCS